MNLIRLFTAIITMFSASSRAAFSSLATRHPRAFPSHTFQSLVARGMSTGAPDTSIVDICKQKIAAHLGTEEVTVTGTAARGLLINFGCVGAQFLIIYSAVLRTRKLCLCVCKRSIKSEEEHHFLF